MAITEYLPVISTLLVPVSAIVTWYYVKRHFQARELKLKDVSIESNTSEVVSKNLELYQRMLDDLDERTQEALKKAYERIKELEIENQLKDEMIERINKERAEMKITISEMKAELEKLKKK